MWRDSVYHTFEWFVLHVRMRHVLHVNESCHTCERLMAHVWMRHITQYQFGFFGTAPQADGCCEETLDVLPTPTCNMTHSYVWNDSTTWVYILIHIHVCIYVCIYYIYFLYIIYILCIYVYIYIYIYMYTDGCCEETLYVLPTPTYMCSYIQTNTYTYMYIYIYTCMLRGDSTRIANTYKWHDSFICVTWLNHMSESTPTHVYV